MKKFEEFKWESEDNIPEKGLPGTKDVKITITFSMMEKVNSRDSNDDVFYSIDFLETIPEVIEKYLQKNGIHDYGEIDITKRYTRLF